MAETVASNKSTWIHLLERRPGKSATFDLPNPRRICPFKSVRENKKLLIFYQPATSFIELMSTNSARLQIDSPSSNPTPPIRTLAIPQQSYLDEISHFLVDTRKNLITDVQQDRFSPSPTNALWLFSMQRIPKANKSIDFQQLSTRMRSNRRCTARPPPMSKILQTTFRITDQSSPAEHPTNSTKHPNRQTCQKRLPKIPLENRYRKLNREKR